MTISILINDILLINDKIWHKYIDGLNFKVPMSVSDDVKIGTMLKME